MLNLSITLTYIACFWIEDFTRDYERTPTNSAWTGALWVQPQNGAKYDITYIQNARCVPVLVLAAYCCATVRLDKSWCFSHWFHYEFIASIYAAKISGKVVAVYAMYKAVRTRHCWWKGVNAFIDSYAYLNYKMCARI